MKNKKYKTLYHSQKKNMFLIKVPKMLKFLFKKYEGSGSSYSRISNNVEIPVKMSASLFKEFFYK